MAFCSEMLMLRRNTCENLDACGQDRRHVLDFIHVQVCPFRPSPIHLIRPRTVVCESGYD